MVFHRMKVKVSPPPILVISRRPEYIEWYKEFTASERREYVIWEPVPEWKTFIRGKSYSRVMIDPQIEPEVKALGKDFIRALHFVLRAHSFTWHIPQDKLVVVKDIVPKAVTQ